MARKTKTGYSIAQSFETICSDRTLPILADAVALADKEEGIFKIRWDGKDIQTAELISVEREAK